jgi:hypothetical protein
MKSNTAVSYTIKHEQSVIPQLACLLNKDIRPGWYIET